MKGTTVVRAVSGDIRARDPVGEAMSVLIAFLLQPREWTTWNSLTEASSSCQFDEHFASVS
ncbi:hypothetical protein ACFWP7_05330 [Streptomyces sp. NPDC058470]|uniref:hypothetical protein n=1 Tax=Streptomyces sp. NPDC058470 TaxID=3346515 RepID=UPI0036498557